MTGRACTLDDVFAWERIASIPGASPLVKRMADAALIELLDNEGDLDGDADNDE